MPVRHDPRTGKFMGGGSLRGSAPGKHVRLATGLVVPKSSGVARVGLGKFRKQSADYHGEGQGFGASMRGQWAKSAPGQISSTHQAMGVVRRRHK